jgi:hypothetical protein
VRAAVPQPLAGLVSKIRGCDMNGPETLDAASDQNHGIINRSQSGTGRWQANRVG